MAKKEKPKFGADLYRKKKTQKKKPKKEVAKSRYGPNVFIALHDAEGHVTVSYWDKDAKSIRDVVERTPAVLQGTAEIEPTACQKIIALVGRTLEATISYAQGGYGPANAVEDVTLNISAIIVNSNPDGENSSIDFKFTILP